MNGKAFTVIVGGAFIIGSLLGKASVSPDVEFIKVPHTVIQKETKTVTKTKPVADICVRALDLGDKIYRAAADFDKTGTDQLDIATAARVAIISNDMQALGKVLEDQNQLQGDTVGFLETLSANIDEYRAARAECKETTHDPSN